MLKNITIIAMIVALGATPYGSLIGQSVTVYSGNNFTGSVLGTVNLGQSSNFTFSGCNGSIAINGSNLAVKVELIPAPAPYPFMFLYTEKNLRNIEPGTNQYCGKTLKISCVPAAQNADQLPQPTAWIPIDRSNVTPSQPALNLSVGDRVLMVRRAFLWENSEDLGCCHGPYASVGLNIHSPNILTDFNSDFDAISQQYVEPWPSYPILAGVKLPGPIYTADNPCNDFGAGCFGIPDDPNSEWIDGPWGACYSKIPAYKWPAGGASQVALIMREGDDTNNDDFMGGIIVDKNNNNPILFKAWKFGWVELQNVTITAADLTHNVDVTDLYWFHNWNGANPSSIHSIAQTPPYDQFLPLPGSTIPQMEATFPAGSHIGLIGGTFPAGTLNKPMHYSAPCQPAFFNN